MKKKQMMMALVSLIVLSAQAQVNFQVSVSNPSKVARTDAPVVVDLSKLGAIGDIQRAVVTVDGKEIPSQLDDINRDCTNDELCFLADLGKKETKTYQVHLYREGEQAQYPVVPLPNSVCQAETGSWLRTGRIFICVASRLIRRPRTLITTSILMASVSKVN